VLGPLHEAYKKTRRESEADPGNEEKKRVYYQALKAFNAKRKELDKEFEELQRRRQQQSLNKLREKKNPEKPVRQKLDFSNDPVLGPLHEAMKKADREFKADPGNEEKRKVYNQALKAYRAKRREKQNSKKLVRVRQKLEYSRLDYSNDPVLSTLHEAKKKAERESRADPDNEEKRKVFNHAQSVFRAKRIELDKEFEELQTRKKQHYPTIRLENKRKEKLNKTPRAIGSSSHPVQAAHHENPPQEPCPPELVSTPSQAIQNLGGNLTNLNSSERNEFALPDTTHSHLQYKPSPNSGSYDVEDDLDLYDLLDEYIRDFH
jgi:hypothetical protein